MAQQLMQVIETSEQKIDHIVGYANRPALAAAASNAYLQQMGLTLGAIGLARVYCAHVLPQVYACAAQIENTLILLDVPLELY